MTDAGLLAAVDWKGRLYLDFDGETLVVGAHGDRGQGVTVLPDGRVVTAAWDGLALFSARGEEIDRWRPPTGAGFQRCWSARSHDGHIVVDHQNGACAELDIGQVGEGLEMSDAPALTAKASGHGPDRTVGFVAGAVAWLAQSEIRRLPLGGGPAETLTEVPEWTKSAAVVERGPGAAQSQNRWAMGPNGPGGARAQRRACEDAFNAAPEFSPIKTWQVCGGST